MKTNPNAIWIRHLSLSVLVLGSLLLLPMPADAKQETVPVEGVSYNVNASMTDNLKLLKGVIVNVTLDSGKIMAGYVKDVGDKLVHIEQLEGREYFDALIRIDSINSVDTRFRTYKR